MRRHPFAPVSTILFCLASVHVSGVQQGKTQTGVVESQPVWIAPAAAKTLSERAAAVDAVLRVRITGPATARAIDIGPNLQRENPDIELSEVVVPVTLYDADVLEVVKERVPGVIGATLPLGTFGGEASWAGKKRVAKRRTADLVPGASYLVFLTHSPEFELMMFVDEDVFRLDGARVTSNIYASQTEYGKRFVGLVPDEAMALIRQAAIQEQ